MAALSQALIDGSPRRPSRIYGGASPHGSWLDRWGLFPPGCPPTATVRGGGGRGMIPGCGFFFFLGRNGAPASRAVHGTFFWVKPAAPFGRRSVRPTPRPAAGADDPLGDCFAPCLLGRGGGGAEGCGVHPGVAVPPVPRRARWLAGSRRAAGCPEARRYDPRPVGSLPAVPSGLVCAAHVTRDEAASV